MRRSSHIRRRHTLLGAALLTLVSFSPSVAWLVSRQYDRLHEHTREPIVLPLAEPAPADQASTAAYVRQLTLYDRTLDGLHVSERRRLTLLEHHHRLYLQARDVYGPAQAAAMLRLIALETRNQGQALGRHSVYSSPEAALAGAERWLAFSAHVLAGASTQTPPQVAASIRAGSPVAMSPDIVLRQARWIRRAAHTTRLPAGALAAVVDTEQSGDRVAYGLSGALRTFTDTAALRTTQMYGSSGIVGELSRTVGLAQMSWEDALKQRERLEALGARLGVPFPTDEAGARNLLRRPYANLLLTASRMRGYLNHAAGRTPLDTAPHTDAWAYVTGPGWHNDPALASSGQMWPYAWNAFFRAALYQRLLPIVDVDDADG